MAASSGSSSGGSWSGGGVRAVRLIRRTPGKLGFSVRGGREHRTGFFVTAVEPSSEAAAQGLQVGDQIVRVNGYPVDDATHRELLQLIQGQTTVLLKVRSVGMIPVKDDDGDELSWRIVDQPSGKESLQHYQRLVLTVPNRAKLGCGICKGPEWKPGIFVQFTKENSIARLGGLSPGDQIVQCNNVSFTPDIPFNQAVSIMRGCGVLELLVCKAAALDLFPGESSGYNSSASSVAGDPPPQTNGSYHNGSHHNGNHVGNGHHTNGNHHNGSPNTSTYSNGNHSNGCKEEDSPSRRREGATIIQVNGPHSNTVPNVSNVAEICVVSQQLETKTTTVLVEVHHSEDDANNQSDVSTDRLTNSSLGSFTSSAGSLTSAISQELERRSKRPVGSGANAKGRAPPQPPKEKLLKGSGLTQEELDQHDRLMQEFKKAHQKMFSGQSPDQSSLSSSTIKEEINDLKVPEKILPEVVSSVRRDNDGELLRKSRNKKHPAPPPPPPPMPKESVVPPCPTPDYDTISVLSDARTCEPSDSTLNSHSTINSNHTSSTILVKDKPLVTIREYPTSQPVKHPSKLDFLSHQPIQQNGHQQVGHPPAVRLQSELSQTLARANLNQQAPRDCSPAVIKINMEPEGKQAPFYLFPENGKRTNGNPPPPFTVANNSVRRKESHGNHNGNHVNGNHPFVNGHHPNGNHHPNGILKNGHSNNVSHVHIHNQDKAIPVKTIKFGNITTVIRDAEPKG